MKARIRKNLPILKLLSKSKPRQRKEIIKKASPDVIKTISECSLNVLNGNLRLTPTQKRKLKKHKNSLRRLAQRKISTNKRRKIIQSGGFLPLLLAPLLAPLVGGLIKKLTS